MNNAYGVQVALSKTNFHVFSLPVTVRGFLQWRLIEMGFNNEWLGLMVPID